MHLLFLFYEIQHLHHQSKNEVGNSRESLVDPLSFSLQSQHHVFMLCEQWFMLQSFNCIGEKIAAALLSDIYAIDHHVEIKSMGIEEFQLSI